MVLQELEEVARILQPDSPTLTAFNKAATQVKNNAHDCET
jgi:hypothetical protein